MRRSGFSIIEALVALALVAIVGIMFPFFISSFALSKKSQIDAQAQTYSAGYFSQVKSMWTISSNFNSSILPPTAPVAANDPRAPYAFPPPSGYSFSTAPAVSPANCGTTNFCTVGFTLLLPDERQVEFITQIARP